MGRNQAEALGCRLKRGPVAYVQSSPRLRCLQTAHAIARSLELPVQIEPALDEIDYGQWSGRSFATFCADPQWEEWNSQRERAAPPGGESMSAVQSRIVSHLNRMREERPNDSIAMVTHAEIIRAAVLHAGGMPLRCWAAIDVELAGIMRIGHSKRDGSPVNREIAA